MTDETENKIENNTAPEDIQRAIETLVDQGLTQAEIKNILDKINESYFESAQSGSIIQELANRIQEQQIILQRKLTDEEKDAIRQDIENNLKK